MTICYDLIFPEYVRHIVDMGADLLINSTDWINDVYQRETWGWGGQITQSLASTRALENLTFLAMANRVGHEKATEELAFDSFGHSCIAGPSGKILASIPEGEGMAVARIDISEKDLDRWKSIATYKEDRRPELVRQ
jgi:5-aminopentanamidase